MKTSQFPRRTFFTLTAAAATAVVAGCSFDDGGNGAGNAATSDGGNQSADVSGDPTTAAAAADKTLRIEYGTFADLDPALSSYGMWVSGNALFEGLVVENDSRTDVLPGVAERWEMSRDGKEYTFFLRKDAVWSDGQPVTANDFKYSLERAITPRPDSKIPTSFDSGIGIEGVADFVAGTSTDFSKVGFTVVDDHTVKYRLVAPNPDFLVQLAFPALCPVPQHVLKAHPEDWQSPANWVSNGPYVLSKWSENASVTMRANPKYWDAASIGVGTVMLSLVAAGGETTLAYDNNEVEMVTMPATDLRRYLEGPTPEEARQVKTGGSITFLALMASKNEALLDVRVRKALSMGLGRSDISKVQPGSSPAPQVVPKAVPGWDEKDGIAFDAEGARSLLAEAGYPNGKGLPAIQILTATGYESLSSAIADTWTRNLGIEVKPNVVEIGVYVKERYALHEGDDIGFFLGSYAGNPSWRYWTNSIMIEQELQRMTLSAKDFAASQAAQETDPAKVKEILTKRSDPAVKEFSDLMAKAFAETDPAKAQDLFHQAARVREQYFLFLPVVWTDNYWLAKTNVKGFTPRLGQLFSWSSKELSIE